jgi:hypothetical protein
MKEKLTKVCSLALALAGAHLNAAPLSTAFTYQGRLDSSGSPANGNYDLRFTVYDALSGGNVAAGAVTNAATAVSGGLFTTSLDFGSAVFNGADRWLEIGVRASGSANDFATLSPRQPLTATPYALFASNSATASSVAANSVTAASIQNGSITAVKIASGQVVKSVNGLTDYVSLSAGPNITLTQTGNSIQIGSSASAGDSGWSLTGNAGTTAANFLGTTDNQPLLLEANSSRILRLEPNTNAPNIIGGSANNYVAAGVEGATIAGGGTLTRSGGAYTNAIAANYGTIGGGLGNKVMPGAYDSAIAGGSYNTVSGGESAIGGGDYNIASGSAATVAGGDVNSATNTYSTIGGGSGNHAYGYAATIAGGHGNTALSSFSSVAGGRYNMGNAAFTAIGGGLANQVSIGSLSGEGIGTISGGKGNVISGHSFGTIGGGLSNVVSTTGGFGVGAQYGTVPGGYNNEAAGDSSFAAGRNAKATHSGSFVFSSRSQPAPSFADERFQIHVFDGFAVDFDSQRDDGGGARWVYIGRSIPGQQIATSTGAYLTDSGVWQNASDRNRKTGFAPVDAQEILSKLMTLPIHTWRYTNEAAGLLHLGPTAQDFRTAFGLGNDDKSIGTVDADGVALTAIQALNRKLEEAVKAKDAEIAKLKSEVAELKSEHLHASTEWESRFAGLQKAVARIEAKSSTTLVVNHRPMEDR